ncbi:unnamed protein product [Linum trigynum]|uniref:Uncharacterized protein n=1 Tax=Linum trigynum TaxID=586398 RepID=A0AAV2C8I3_9ROSI
MDEKDITNDLLKEYLTDNPVEELNYLVIHPNTNQTENSNLLNRNISLTENSTKLPKVEHAYKEDVPAIPEKLEGKQIDHDTNQAKDSSTIPKSEKNDVEDIAPNHVSPKQQINQDTDDQTKNSSNISEEERNYKEDKDILSMKIRDHLEAAKKAFEEECQKKNNDVAIKAKPIAFCLPEGSSNTNKAAKKAFEDESQEKNNDVAIKAEPIAFCLPEGSSNANKAAKKAVEDESQEKNNDVAIKAEPIAFCLLEGSSNANKAAKKAVEDESQEKNNDVAIKAEPIAFCLPEGSSNANKAAKKAVEDVSQEKNNDVAIKAEPIAFCLPEGSSNANKVYSFEKKKQKKKQPSISWGIKPVSFFSDIPTDIMANLQGLEKWLMNQEEMEATMEHKLPVQLSMARRLQGWTMELKQRTSDVKKFDAYYFHQDLKVRFRSVIQVINFVLHNSLWKPVKGELPSKRKGLVSYAPPESSQKKRKITKAEEIEVQEFLAEAFDNLQNGRWDPAYGGTLHSGREGDCSHAKSKDDAGGNGDDMDGDGVDDGSTADSGGKGETMK